MGASELLQHAVEAPLGLTRAQRGIWLGQQTDPASPAYVTAECVALEGPLDIAAFTAAVHAELARCDALHMRFQQVGDDVLQTLRPGTHWHMAVVDLAGDAEADEWMRQAVAQPIDLAHDLLFSTALLRVGPASHRWFLRAHHIALDGFGHALLAGRVAQSYRERLAGQARPDAELPQVRMRQLVDEDQRYRQSDAAERDRTFWLEQVSGAGEPPSLAPAAPLSREVVRGRGVLPSARTDPWRSAAVAAQVDVFSWLLAGVAAWLHHRTGSTMLILGLPMMNRLGSVALRVPCMAMNIVPLRIEVNDGDTSAALAARVQAAWRALRPHARYRYETLRDDLRDHAGPQRLFGPVVNLMPFERPLDFSGVQAQSRPVSAGPVEDLSITIAPRGDDWQFDIDANPNAYIADEVNAWRGELLAVLDRLAANPDLPLTDAWRALPSHVVYGDRVDAGVPLVLQSFIARAKERPAHAALSHDGRTMTYQELLFSVQALAGHLAGQGARDGARVVVLLPRSMQAVTVILAVLWAGASYVPIDPEGPLERLALVLEDSAPALVVTLGTHASKVRGCHRLLCLDDAAAYEPRMTDPAPTGALSVAYVIYTSGSTGRPNGVLVSHAALAHFIHGARERYGMCAEDRMLQFAPLHFDASVEEIFLPLTTGATMVLRTDAMLDSMADFAAGMVRERITVIDLPTAFWHELAYGCGQADGPPTLPACVRLVVIGGEAALPERVARWRMSGPAHAVLLNTYGPTEATVICTTSVLAGPGADAVCPVAAADSVPIGRPLSGVGVVVVDERLRPVPPGVAGELCVLGGGLASGYLNQPERTAQRFLKLQTLPGAPMAYRTGDRVRQGVDGQLRFLGRRDDELKISGHRVDPLEVETALLTCAGVREAAVVSRAGAFSDTQLTAYIVAAPMPSAAALRDHLSHRVAAPAVPSQFVAMERLPRNANNKIDRGALRRRPSDSPTATPTPTAVAEALTTRQADVIAVWRDVLQVTDLSAASDFFAVGGRSLQAIQVAHRMGMVVGCDVPVSLLFRHPTVAALALALDAPVAHRPPPAAVGSELAPVLTIQVGEGPALFCVHPAEGLAWCYFGLTRAMPSLPIIGLQAEGLTGAAPATFDAMADAATLRVRSVQPAGPYRLLGWSSGAGLAHAIAARLQASGEVVDLLAAMDGYPSEAFDRMPAPGRRDALEAVLDVIGESPTDTGGQPLSDAALRQCLVAPGSTLATYGDALVDRLVDVALHTMQQYRGVRHARFDGPMLFFRATKRRPETPEPSAWLPHVSGPIDVVDVDSTHSAMSQPVPLGQVARRLALDLAPGQTP